MASEWNHCQKHHHLGKRPCPQCADEQRIADLERERDELREMLGFDTPGPLPDVLERLADAADHLLDFHDCDAMGHEGVAIARDDARRYATRLRAALADEGGDDAD